MRQLSNHRPVVTSKYCPLPWMVPPASSMAYDDDAGWHFANHPAVEDDAPSNFLEARYTLFVFIRKQWQNYFFAKKFEFCKTGRKHLYTLFVIDSNFRKYEYFVQSNEKSPLSFVQKPLRQAKTAQNAERKTCSRNVGENALHTIRVS